LRPREEEKEKKKGKVGLSSPPTAGSNEHIGAERENTVGLCRGSNKKGKNVVASPNLDVGREGEKSAFNSWL